MLLVGISLIPFIWFIGKGDSIINGVDTNFPLNPKLWLIRRFFMWNNLSNGGSDFSFAPAGIFFHIIQFIPYIIGLSLQLTEKISMIFWFGLIVLNSYVFAGNFIKGNRLLKVLFVTLYALNIYMFNTWENVKVANLSLVAGIPLLLHIFINLKDNLITKSKALLLLVAVSFILSGAGINPAYFITAILTLFVFAFTTVVIEGKFKEVSKAFLSMVVVIAVISSYWLIPTISFVTRTVSQSSSIGSIGFNNWLDSLSENTSIINVLRLQGAWDWYSFDSVTKTPLFLPYTPNYFFRIPFVLFSFVVPALAMLSLFLIRKEKKIFYIFFLLLLLLGAFLGSGSHNPTGVLFNWLTKHLPYFSLFRSPWYIFTPMLTLALSGLTVLFFENFKVSKITNLLVSALIVANVVYCYPLVTGRIFRPSKPDGFLVTFPSYIFEAGNDLSTKSKNRTITYPDDQLEKFNWGYIGVEPVVNLFTDNEMVFPAINNTQSPFAQMVSEFYEKIKIGNIEAVKNILSKLNVDSILEKTDQQTLSAHLDKDLWNTSVFGRWIIHRIDKNNVDSRKLTLANNFYYTHPISSPALTSQVGLVSSDEHLINPADSVVEKISFYQSNAGRIIVSSNSQQDNYNNAVTKESDLSKVVYNFEIPEDGLYSPIIESYGLTANDFKTFSLVNGNETIRLQLIKLDDSYAYFDRVFFKKGDYSYTYAITNQKVYTESFNSKGGQLNLLNTTDEDLNYDVKLPDFNYNRKYFISFDYSWSKGNKPLVLIDQRSKNTLFKIDKIGLEGETAYSTHRFYYSPVQTDSEITLTFVSPKTNSDRGTLVNYDNLYISEVFTNKLFFVKESKLEGEIAKIEYIKKSPVRYEGVVKGVKNPQTLIFAENYTTGWKLKVTDLNGNKIRYRADHFTVDLYANAWYIDTVNQDFKFEIYYDPQKYFNVGMLITVVSILSIIGFYTFSKFKK